MRFHSISFLVYIQLLSSASLLALIPDSLLLFINNDPTANQLHLSKKSSLYEQNKAAGDVQCILSCSMNITHHLTGCMEKSIDRKRDNASFVNGGPINEQLRAGPRPGHGCTPGCGQDARLTAARMHAWLLPGCTPVCGLDVCMHVSNYAWLQPGCLHGWVGGCAIYYGFSSNIIIRFIGRVGSGQVELGRVKLGRGRIGLGRDTRGTYRVEPSANDLLGSVVWAHSII